jgi:hypothetical protein
MPPPINNKLLTSYIKDKQRNGQDGEVKENSDFFSFKQSMFMFFLETYGGGPIIKVKYYHELNNSLNKNFL